MTPSHQKCWALKSSIDHAIVDYPRVPIPRVSNRACRSLYIGTTESRRRHTKTGSSHCTAEDDALGGPLLAPLGITSTRAECKSSARRQRIGSRAASNQKAVLRNPNTLLFPVVVIGNFRGGFRVRFCLENTKMTSTY